MDWRGHWRPSQSSLMGRLLLISLVVLCNLRSLSICQQQQWQDNIRPKLFAQLTDRDYQSFSGILRQSQDGIRIPPGASSPPG